MKNPLYLISSIVFFLFTSCQPTMDTNSKPTAKSLAFIGSYTQKEGHVDGKGAGISIYETGSKATDWKSLATFSDIINPSYLCLSPKHPIIYAVSEQGPNVPAPKSVIKVIQYDPESFTMKALQTISAEGDAPCYISTDRDGQFLFVANYVSGNIVLYNINANGTLQAGISSQHQGRGPHDRQEAPHAHFAQQHPFSNAIYAVDLGIDQVVQYQASVQGLLAQDTIHTQAGSGPRHLVWHPNGHQVYILNELTGSIESWNWQHETRKQVQTAMLNPNPEEQFAGAGDIHISKDGRFLYASLRGDFDEIIVLKTEPELQVIQRVPAGGEVPRNFAINSMEDYLAVASQNSDRISLFKRDVQSGLLDESPEVVNVKTPVCVVFKGF